MLDCRRKGLKLLYYPDAIATVLPGASNWFHGYDRVYMENFGWSTRRLLGPRVGFVYLLYWLLFKRNIYMSGGLSAYSFMKSISKGFFLKDNSFADKKEECESLGDKKEREALFSDKSSTILKKI